MSDVPSVELSGDVRAAISNAMVAAKKRHYGKGPTQARTYIEDDYVFCVMHEGLTANEETLLAHGEQELVRNYRLKFQQTQREPLVAAVEEITGRRVAGYTHQITFEPTRMFDIFVLESE